MTFALLLELCHHVMDHSNATRNGAWSDCKNFCFWNFPLIELADKTMGIIGFGRIGQQVADVAEAFGMKNTAFLINTSRGSLIVEKDLAEALNSGVIAGAALDVLSVEPPSKENPLLRACNCLITPHISCATKEARARLMDIAADNLKAFLEGNAVNVVNK